MRLGPCMTMAIFVLGETFDPVNSEAFGPIFLKFSAIALLAETFRLASVRPQSDRKRGSWERTPNFAEPQNYPTGTDIDMVSRFP